MSRAQLPQPGVIKEGVRIGIDLGGTKIEGLCLSDGGEVRTRHRIPTPTTSYREVLDALASLVATLEQAAGCVGESSIGVATPGFLAPKDGLLRNSNLAVLNGFPIDRDLTARMGRPVRVANDANCFVLSEATDGAAAGAEAATGIVFGATLGTGVGGGLVVDGRVWAGANGSAAEWSHLPLPFLRPDDGPGAGCPCGVSVCIESFVSGRGLAWFYGQASGRTVKAVDVAERASAGEAAALAAFVRYEDGLARALALIIDVVDPSVIVLGGGIANNDRLYTNVPKLWERYTVARDLATRLVRAKHGDASGVRGAAWLWPRA